MKIIKRNKKALFTMIGFWIIVGITSGLLYDLEWYIQHVVMFNGMLAKDLAHGQLAEIKSFDQFYENYNNASLPFHSVTDSYYEENMKSAMSQEGMIFAAGALLAAMVSGPILTLAINKKKNYTWFVVPVILGFAILLASVAPMISSIALLWAIFTPMFGLGYSYRMPLDPWASTYARKTKIRISFVRVFYEVGAGAAALAISQVYLQYAFYAKEPGYQSGIAFYLAAFFLLVLALFIVLFMPNKKMFEDTGVKNETAKIETEVKFSGTSIKKLIFSKPFIIGIIIFTLLIGTDQAFGSVWVNTIENEAAQKAELGSVAHIGYQKAFSVIPSFLVAVFIFQFFHKFTFKTFMIIVSIVSTASWLIIGTFVYVVEVPMIVTDLIGGIAKAFISAFAVLLGYEWVARITTIKTRNVAFIVFNTMTYGIGGILFVELNGFLSKTKIEGMNQGYIVWIVMSLSCFVALILSIFTFKSPRVTDSELDESFLDHEHEVKQKVRR